MNTRITELSEKFATLKTKFKEASELADKINEEWKQVERDLLDAMVEEGVNSVSLAGLGQFTMATKNRLSVTAANKPTFFEYLKASGNGGLLKEDVNAMTLTAFLKTHLEELIDVAIIKGLDPVEARNDALQFLNSKGAAYFSEKTIRFKGE